MASQCNGLDFARLRIIQRLGAEVVYPAQVPARFSTVKIVTRSENDEKQRPHYDYTIEYCDKRRQCIEVGSAWCGIGSELPDADRQITGQSAIFGTVVLNVYKPHTEQNNTDGTSYQSDWLDKISTSLRKSQERIGCSNSPMRHYFLEGYGLSDEEAITVVTSLVEMK